MRGRPDLVVVFVMIFIIGTFGMNFPIFTSTMATQAFGVGAERVRPAHLGGGGRVADRGPAVGPA